MNKINVKKIIMVASSIALVSPLLAMAQTVTQFDPFVNTMISVLKVINIVIVVCYALAFLALVWGVVKYIFSAGDEEAKGQGQRIMIGGIIGLFVITAAWGLVRFVAGALNINQNTVGQASQFDAIAKDPIGGL